MASGTRQRNQRGGRNSGGGNPSIGTGERGGNRGRGRIGGRARGRIGGRIGGRGQPQGTEFVTRNDLMAEMGRLQDSIQAMFDQNRHNEAETPDPEPEGAMPITPAVIPVTRRCDYKMFLSCRPPTYSGDRDPVKAMKWMKEIEAIFKTSKCADEDRVLYGAAMLKGDALYWWESFIHSKGSDVYSTLSWEEFVIAYREAFCPQAAVRQLEEEFMNLQQGNLSVRDYTASFLEKSRFAEYYVATEKMKTERFIYGLNSGIRRLVIATGPETFSAAVDAAENVERDNKRDASDKSVGKRKSEEMTYGSTEYEISRFDSRQPHRPNEKLCPKCNRVHQGNCYVDPRSCYKCGRAGHIAKNCYANRFCFVCNSPDHIQSDCPQWKIQQGGTTERPTSVRSGQIQGSEEPKAKGRVFQMTTQEDEEILDEDTGTFLINSIRAKVTI